MDGQMLHLSNELSTMLRKAKIRASVDTHGGSICLYAGKEADKLRFAGYLNLVFWDRMKGAYGLSISDFENAAVPILGQEKMRKLNSSEIVGLEMRDGRLLAQHWDGFRTEFGQSLSEVVGQSFTK